MGTTLCLFTCTLLAAQPPSGSAQLLIPRLSRGQELHYIGTFTEEFMGQRVQFNRSYRLDSRVFVLDTLPRGAEVAFFTVLRLQASRPERAGGAGARTEPCSVRLELAQVDLQGRLTSESGASLVVPLERPATVECGAFVEVPSNRVSMGNRWSVTEKGRPPRTWRVAGMEVINGTRCFKLQGVQQSDDWDHPRADRTAWRRRDTVWLGPRLGIAYKVERVIERREPARREPTQRSIVTYELEYSLVYPGRLYEERLQEIRQARTFAAAAEPMLGDPGVYGPRSFDVLLAKIAFYLDNHPDTPYREAVRSVQRQLESVRRGETPPVRLIDEREPLKQADSRPRLAPDLTARDLVRHQTVRLSQFRGHPILMIFFSPTSQTLDEVLRFGQSITQTYGTQVTVLGLTVSEDISGLWKQWNDLKLTFPLLSGSGLRLTFGVDTTPKLIVLDADGVVRSSYVGWGSEMPSEIKEELRHELQLPGGK